MTTGTNKKPAGKGFIKSDRFKKLTASIKRKNAFDKNIFDLVLKTLYNAAHKNALDFETEILDPEEIHLSKKEKERIWNVLINSGFVNPIIGFGNAGKLSLTKPGFALMEQYCGYLEYLKAMESGDSTETIIMPINPLPEKSEVKHITPHQHSGK